jgi:hypothetical protein
MKIPAITALARNWRVQCVNEALCLVSISVLVDLGWAEIYQLKKYNFGHRGLRGVFKLMDKRWNGKIYGNSLQ